MLDLDKERCIRFTPGKWIKSDWFLPLVAGGAFVLFCQLVYVPWEDIEISWSAWVQAIGSLIGIGVAIAVADGARKQVLEIRAEENAERDLAHAIRLRMLIWESVMATRDFVSRVEQAQHAYELEQIFQNGPLESYQARSIRPAVTTGDVSFFQRIMLRAMHNLDDDLNAARHRIAGKFRYNLSVLINVLERRVDTEADDGLLSNLENALAGFEADLEKLKEYCPPLVSLYED